MMVTPGRLATRCRWKRMGSASKMALRTAASPTHEVACRGRRSDRGTPLREREGGGGLPENAAPKRAWRVVDVRDGAGRWGFGVGKIAGGDREEWSVRLCESRSDTADTLGGGARRQIAVRR